jgi:hypothetical protein
MTALDDARRLAVGRQIWEVQCSLAAFDFGDEQFLLTSVDEAMRETEAAFYYEDFDKAERLAKVTNYLVQREIPKFTDNPQRWIAKCREQQTYHQRKSFIPEDAA